MVGFAGMCVSFCLVDFKGKRFTLSFHLTHELRIIAVERTTECLGGSNHDLRH
jgi:hypothetical protein